MAHRSPSRRRRRHLRVTVAAGILAVVAATSISALLIRSGPWLVVGIVVALVGGIAATRIVHSEMLRERQTNARERARLAEDHRAASIASSKESAAFAEAMAGRIKARDRSIRELEGTIRLAEKRATLAEHRAEHEAANAKEANLALAELQQRVQDAKAELIDELAEWEGAELDTVVDLMSWEERVMTKAELERLKKQA